MSDGQLLMRVRAYKREEAWAPTYVADDLAGTTREAARQRQDAVLLAALADRATDTDRAELQSKATEAEALAELLDQRVRELIEADGVRARWYVHTSETRSAADRARAELVDRGVDPEAPADAVPIKEWLAAHRRDEGLHRPITAQADFAEEQRRTEAVRLVEPTPVDAAETAVPDVRELAAAEPIQVARPDEGRGRIASAADTAAAVERAQRALLELRARAEAEQRRADEESIVQHARDGQREHAAAEAMERVDS